MHRRGVSWIRVPGSGRRVGVIVRERAQKCMNMTTTSARYRSPPPPPSRWRCKSSPMHVCALGEPPLATSAVVEDSRGWQRMPEEHCRRAHVFCLLLPLGVASLGRLHCARSPRTFSHVRPIIPVSAPRTRRLRRRRSLRTRATRTTRHSS